MLHLFLCYSQLFDFIILYTYLQLASYTTAVLLLLPIVSHLRKSFIANLPTE